MGQTWYYRHDGQEVGPVPSVELRRLVAAGVLNPESLIRRSDKTRWIQAQEIKHLFSAAPPSVLPVPAKAKSKLAKPQLSATPLPPTSMGAIWFLHRAGTTYGPYPQEQLDQMKKAGELLAEDQLCREGTDQWGPASVLFATPSTPPPFVPAAIATPVKVPIATPVAVPNNESTPMPANKELPPPFPRRETDEDLPPRRGDRILYRAGLHWKMLLVPWLTLIQSVGSLLIALWWLFPDLRSVADQPHLEIVAEGVQHALRNAEIRHWLWVGVYVVIGLNTLWFVLRLIRYLRTSITLTERGIVTQSGIFFVWPVETSWRDVRAVQVSEPVLGSILGYGTVVIVGEGGMTEIKEIRRAQYLKQAADRWRSRR